jgi:hypothetical protein
VAVIAVSPRRKVTLFDVATRLSLAQVTCQQRFTRYLRNHSKPSLSIDAHWHLRLQASGMSNVPIGNLKRRIETVIVPRFHRIAAKEAEWIAAPLLYSSQAHSASIS